MRSSIVFRSRFFYFLILVIYLGVIFWTCSLRTGLFFNGGDEGRHALNGVFIMDLIRGQGWRDPIQYLYKYFSQYPGLSIHLAQPAFYLWEAGIFHLVGVSFFSAKLSVAILGLLALVVYYCLIDHQLGERIALMALCLFATNWVFLLFFCHVMLEIPSLLFLFIISYVVLHQRKAVKFPLALLLVASSVLVSHKLFFLAPAILAFYGIKDRPTFSRAIVINALVYFGMLAVIFLIGHLRNIPSISRVFHLNYFDNAFDWTALARDKNIIFYGGSFIRMLTPLGAFTLCTSLLWIFWSKKIAQKPIFIYSLLMIFWNFAVVLLFTTWKVDRLLIDSIPFASIVIALFIYSMSRNRGWTSRLLALAIVVGICIGSLKEFDKRFHYVRGYETAARFLARVNDTNSPVLFDGYQDGAFLFYSRSLDNDVKRTVFRADKVLFKSNFDFNPGNIRTIAKDVQECAAIIQKTGVRFIVSESLDFNIPIQNQFRAWISESPLFKKIGEFPIESSLGPDLHSGSPGYKGKRIFIFEYLAFKANSEATPVLPKTFAR